MKDISTFVKFERNFTWVLCPFFAVFINFEINGMYRRIMKMKCFVKSAYT